jgi:ABC-type amino acid transport substrate-binding protein
MNARVGWVSGSESRLMQALTQHQLDLVIGGIEAETAWRERVGLSIPYFRSATVVAAKPGTSAPSDLHGQQVAIAEGDPAGSGSGNWAGPRWRRAPAIPGSRPSKAGSLAGKA